MIEGCTKVLGHGKAGCADVIIISKQLAACYQGQTADQGHTCHPQLLSGSGKVVDSLLRVGVA